MLKGEINLMINTIKKSANKNYTDVTEKWINASLKKGKVKIAQCYIYNNIKYVVDGKLVPHVYRDHSLCLFYPRYQEWDYKASWAETIIPWTSLWLYYYEIWLQTGEWLGGGIHGNPHKNLN